MLRYPIDIMSAVQPVVPPEGSAPAQRTDQNPTVESMDRGTTSVNTNVGMKGADGIVSNIFNKDQVVTVVTTPRVDTCCESGLCLGPLCSSLFGWYFKIPDCVGCGADCTCCIGKLGATLKMAQSPTVFDSMCNCTCLDISTCCNCDSDVCVLLCKNASTCKCCLIAECAWNAELGLMKTCFKTWFQCLFCDVRAAMPVQKEFAPPGCGCCGCMFRPGSQRSCGWQMRSATKSGQAW